MRNLKACGLVVLAALVLAIFNAAPAMGEGVTALCKVHDSPCAEKDQVKNIHLANKGIVIFRNDPIDILCLEFLIDAEVLNPDDPQQLHTTAFDLYKCGWGSAHSECTVTMEELPNFTVSQTPLDLGVLIAENGKMHLFCEGAFKLMKECTFDLTGMEVGLEGALHTEKTGHGMATDSSEIWREGFGILCYEEASFEFLLEPLEHVHIVSQAEGAGTALCKTHNAVICPEGDLTQSLHLVAPSPSLLLSDVANIECEDSLATAGVSALAAMPERQKVTVTKFDWKECHIEGLTGDCTVTAELSPVIELLKTALNLATATVPKVEIAFKCNVLDLVELECAFSDSVELTVEGASHKEESGHGRITADSAELELLKGGDHCPDSVKWDATYESLEDFYVVA